MKHAIACPHEGCSESFDLNNRYEPNVVVVAQHLTEHAIHAERNRLRLLLLSVASQCGGPVEFALRKVAEGIDV